MFAAGQQDMQQMDQYTMEKIGLPGVVLMENAGARVVEEIVAMTNGNIRKVVILAGGGNNGGDGFVIARRLFDIGWEPVLCLLVNPDRLKGDAKIHFDVYVNRGLPVLHNWAQDNLTKLEDEFDKADIIVDAILGTGVKGAVREPFKTVISMVNALQGKKAVLSVDIPSGVESDSGKVESTAIKATKTITFVYPKKGFFLQDGPKCVGEWKAVDISVPPSITSVLGLDMPQVITEQLVKTSIPTRPQQGHKGTFGHALVIGGSRQYIGAPVYTAKAVLHSGAGLATLAVPESIYPIVAAQNPESLMLPLPGENGHFSDLAIAEISSRLQLFDCIAIGPGMGRFPNGEIWMKSFLSILQNQPIVVDADALYLLRNDLGLLRSCKGTVIITPHPGEMATLLNKTIKEVEENRIEVARKFANDHGVFLLLKGHRSIIACPDGSIYINPFGHDALGKGGSGDVLTGLIASFLAQGATPLHAMVSASYLHARAGEEKAKELSHYGVMPLDIIDSIKHQLAILF
ncbi:NAD(P)H-hydrate dehydratase [Bacillus litorisediminis]|uniref:NAD(P)H-hydrate dehydratase n=1 Tax=Bacillus litorisediminis TaxID=2922713 RepID=UPI001FB0466C|nr:NAD(P)H-hydrate dehydratase [Bacillus litorisediminis]